MSLPDGVLKVQQPVDHVAFRVVLRYQQTLFSVDHTFLPNSQIIEPHSVAHWAAGSETKWVRLVMFWQERQKLGGKLKSRQWMLDGPIYVNPFIAPGYKIIESVKPNTAYSMIERYGEIAGPQLDPKEYLLIYPNLYLLRRERHELIRSRVSGAK